MFAPAPAPTYQSKPTATPPMGVQTAAPATAAPATATATPAAPAAPAATASAALPAVSGPQFTGIGAGQTRTGLQTMDYLNRTWGQTMSPEQQREAAQYIGYTDPTGNAAINADDYNRLVRYAAERAGGSYQDFQAAPPPNTGGPDPYPTEGPLTPTPFPEPTTGGQGSPTTMGTQAPAPSYTAPRYQQQAFTPPTFDEMVAQDPTYARRLNEGLGAAESRAASRGMLGTGSHVRALNREAQDFASNEFGNFYNRRANEYNVNTGERRYEHEADSNATQTEYAPRLLTWNRQEDQAQRGRELSFDRSWQRETYGRDDNYRRNRATQDDYRYQNDDRQRNVDREESRRRFLAELGQA